MLKRINNRKVKKILNMIATLFLIKIKNNGERNLLFFLFVMLISIQDRISNGQTSHEGLGKGLCQSPIETELPPPPPYFKKQKRRIKWSQSNIWKNVNEQTLLFDGVLHMSFTCSCILKYEKKHNYVTQQGTCLQNLFTSKIST